MDGYEGLTPAQYAEDRKRAMKIPFSALPLDIQRRIINTKQSGLGELFKGASSNVGPDEFLNNYIAEIPVYVAQVTPKNMGYGFEADLGGTLGGPEGIYIRGTFPEEGDYRQRQFEQMKERMGNPFRGA